MAEEVSMEGVDPNHLDEYARPAEGRYHFVCQHVDEAGGKDNDKLVIDLQVLAGTTEGMKGRVHSEQYLLGYDEWMRRVRYAAAVALGLTTIDDLALAKQGKKSISIDWQKAVGRHVCGDIRKNAKGYLHLYNMCPVGSPDAKGIPIDEAAIKATQGGGATFGSPPKQESPPAADDLGW